jgi:hypothetical protein
LSTPADYATRLTGSAVCVLRGIESAAERLATRRWLCCAVVAGVALAARLAVLPVLPKPLPAVHDEFSYLLGGETFAMGRLANPPHALAPFFETYHVNFQPTYASKYPPGQAAFLAAGIRLFGHPWYGVWLSVGLMCGLLTWMLQGWAPPKFALLGGVLAVLWFGISHYWVNSYWGGAVAACGGALVLGALPRLVRRPGPGSALAGAIGVAVLANSRPFEGAVFVLAAVAGLLWWAGRARTLVRLLRPRILWPVAVIGLLAAGWMAWYNYRLTGSPTTFPYSVNQQRYAASPVFWILPPLPPKHREYRDSVMKEFWEVWDADYYTRARQMPLGIPFRFADMAGEMLTTGAGGALVLPLALSLLLVRLRRVAMLIFVITVFTAGLLLEKSFMVHYAAPATGLILLLAVFGLRLLRAMRIRSVQIGLPVIALITALAVWLLMLETRRAVASSRPANLSTHIAVRTQVEEQLKVAGGRHVVVVRYGSNHSAHQEFIYNGPDIDRQRIVWALDRGRAENQKLLQYYPGRVFWLMQPDLGRDKLEKLPWTIQPDDRAY